MTAVQVVFLGGPLDLSRQMLDTPPSTYRVAMRLPSQGLGSLVEGPLPGPSAYYEAVYRLSWGTAPDGDRLAVYVLDEYQTDSNLRKAASEAAEIADLRATLDEVRRQRRWWRDQFKRVVGENKSEKKSTQPRWMRYPPTDAYAGSRHPERPACAARGCVPA